MKTEPQPLPLLLLLLLLLLLAPSGAAAAGGGDWPNYGGNGGRNGLSPEVGPTAATLLWSNTADFSIIAWHPFVEDGRVFTVREAGFPQNGGAANDAIVAYDLHTGAELWRATLPYGGDTSQEWIAWIGGVRDGRLYASRSSNLQPQPLHCLDAATGAPLWTSAASTEAWAHDGVVFAPDGDPVVGDRLSVTRVDAPTGATVWSVARSCPVSGNCGAAATADALYIDQPAPGANRLTKLDLATGAVLYSSPNLPGFTDQNSPFVHPDGDVVLFSRTQNNPAVDFLYAFADTGTALTELWHVPVRWTTSHEHGVGPDGTIYAFSQSDELIGLDPATGATVASTSPLAPLGSPNLSPKTVVDALGRVYVSNGWASTPAGDGRVWAFDATLSVNLFTLNLDRLNAGGPVLAEAGTLVVCDRTGVYAYRSTAPGAALCFGDGSGTPCPCGNDSTARGEGCVTSAAHGMRITGGGTASVTLDDLELAATGCPLGNTGIFYSGKTSLSPGNPLFDGLQCAGGDVRRYGGLFQTTGVAADGGFVAQDPSGIYFNPGDTVYFQYWTRDVAGGPTPCGLFANLSPAYAVTMGP